MQSCWFFSECLICGKDGWWRLRWRILLMECWRPCTSHGKHWAFATVALAALAKGPLVFLFRDRRQCRCCCYFRCWYCNCCYCCDAGVDLPLLLGSSFVTGVIILPLRFLCWCSMMTIMMILLTLMSQYWGQRWAPHGRRILSDRGRWLCWRRCCPFYSDDIAFVVIFVVIIVSWPLSLGLVCVVALLLVDNGVCCWIVDTAIMWRRCIVRRSLMGGLTAPPAG